MFSGFSGILYINPGDLSWNAYVTSWLAFLAILTDLHLNRCETLEHTAVKTNLAVLFDRYVPILQVGFEDIHQWSYQHITLEGHPEQEVQEDHAHSSHFSHSGSKY